MMHKLLLPFLADLLLPPLFPNTDFGTALGKTAFPVGIVAGVIGLVLVALAYPVYNRELKNQREKAAPEILRLTDALMK